MELKSVSAVVTGGAAGLGRATAGRRRGALVKRHRRPRARRTAAALAPYFAKVHLLRVRREAGNILVCATAPRHRGRDAAGR